MNEDIAVSYTQTGHTKEEKGLNWERGYTYNAAERLSKVEDKRNDRTSNYTYDPFGRRISKTITQGKATQTTYYIYGEHGLMAEANEQGTLTKAYGFHPDAQTNGLWSTNPVWQADISNGKLKDEQTQWHYLHTDHLGTPYMATNKQGQRTWRAHAKSFGEAIIDKNSTTTVNLRFPGQYYDEETGTHYNFHRDYSPYTGRYLQADPIGLDGGENLYAYVYNDPIGYIDPEGEVPPLAPIVWTYMRCVASCTARSMVHDALTGGLGDCIPETLADHTKDCALECVFPNRLLGKLNAGKSNFWPPSLTPPGGGRRAAFNEAKRRNGIPTSQSPNSVKPNVDRRGKRQPGRVYEYSVPGRKEPVIIRDDAAGHYYGAGNSQNRGPHFNDSRGNHYDY